MKRVIDVLKILLLAATVFAAWSVCVAALLSTAAAGPVFPKP